MNSHPIPSNNYIFAAQKFSESRMRALQDSLLAKLAGKNSSLAMFPQNIQRDHPNRKMLGVKDIRLDQIVGTLNREADFDHKFRPLGKHLLDRWVNIFANLDPDSWQPILVHKVGEQYYVEDGHHRVSVAQSLGMVFIQAQVWEYPVQTRKMAVPEQAQCCGQRSYAQACTAK